MHKTQQLLDLLGCEVPVIQAPMAGGVQDEKLALAVCRAGGLGSLPAAMLSADELRRQVQTLRAHSDRPFNVNFFAHQTPEISPAQMQAWLEVLAPYFAEFGLSPPSLPAAGGRQPFGAAQAELVEELRLPVVSFHFGLPAPELLARVKAAGAVVLSSATTVAEARWLAANGADAVIAQGLEAGGHRGMFLSRDPATQMGLFSLLPQIARAVDMPVIAAGGIADGQTAAAAGILGADAVQAGSAFLLTQEAAAFHTYRDILAGPAAQSTRLTNLISGGCARGVENRLTRELGGIHSAAPPFPLAQTAIAALIQAAAAQGNQDFNYYWAGENAPLARPQTAAQLLAELAKGFTRAAEAV